MFLSRRFNIRVFSNAGAPPEPLTPSPVPTPTPEPPKPPTPPVKTFSQEEVNAIIAKEKRTFQTKEGELLIKLEKAVQGSQEKEALEQRLEELRTAQMSKEELAKEAAQKEKKEYEKQINTWKTKAETIARQYENEKIERDLLDAATEHDAFRPQQVVTLLRGSTRLVEEIDEATNKPTGRMVPRSKVETVKDGKLIMLDLRPSDAVKVMKEDAATHGNLFKSGAISGVGSNAGRQSWTQADELDIDKMPQEKVNELMRTNPGALGLNRR